MCWVWLDLTGVSQGHCWVLLWFSWYLQELLEGLSGAPCVLSLSDGETFTSSSWRPRQSRVVFQARAKPHIVVCVCLLWATHRCLSCLCYLLLTICQDCLVVFVDNTYPPEVHIHRVRIHNISFLRMERQICHMDSLQPKLSNDRVELLCMQQYCISYRFNESHMSPVPQRITIITAMTSLMRYS